MADDPKYDVAISFLARDQAAAGALAERLAASRQAHCNRRLVIVA